MLDVVRSAAIPVVTALTCGVLGAILVLWGARVRRPVLRHPGGRVERQTSADEMLRATFRLAGVHGLKALRVIPRYRSVRLSPTGTLCTGIAVITLPASFVLWPPGALVEVVVLGSVPFLRKSSAARRRRREIESELPLIIDLFRIAIRGGLSIYAATAAVVKHADGLVAAELESAIQEVATGRRIADALEAVVDRTDEAVRPLVGTLVSSDRYGAPITATLDLLGYEARAEEERRVERVAKYLTVQLLFPVACCTLPAFVLLTVAPLFAGSIGGLATSFS